MLGVVHVQAPGNGIDLAHGWQERDTRVAHQWGIVTMIFVLYRPHRFTGTSKSHGEGGADRVRD